MNRLRTIRRWLPILVLSLFFGLTLLGSTATPIYADEKDPPGAEPCASCHSPETDAWLDSSHAIEKGDTAMTSGATCAACHGEYSKGHPDDGAMELLTVDSSLCQGCHESTYDQWEHSIHASQNVQCIGCHQVHSQELRLTDEQLCRACHKEAVDDPFHTAHWYGDVACTNCHMADMQLPDSGQLVSNTSQPVAMALPSHDFVTVSSSNCLDCHKESVGPEAARNDPTLNELHSVTANAEVLGNKLSAAQKVNKSLEQMTLVSLGLGIAVGGMLGLLLAIVIGYLSRKEATHEK